MADRGIKDGVRVNAINPGSITTDRLQTRIKLFATENNFSIPEATTAMALKLGIGRFGTPEDIAKAVAFLASSAAEYFQGSLIDIDGGQTRSL